MNLINQIKTIISSFLYGIFIYYFLKINKKLIYNKNTKIKIISTILIYIIITLLYFIIILKINNAYFHIYEILYILLGFILIAFKYKK